MEPENRDGEAGDEATTPSEDIQEPAESVDFQSLDLDEDELADKTSVTCNVASL
jgi:hypothetical protein